MGRPRHSSKNAVNATQTHRLQNIWLLNIYPYMREEKETFFGKKFHLQFVGNQKEKDSSDEKQELITQSGDIFAPTIDISSRNKVQTKKKKFFPLLLTKVSVETGSDVLLVKCVSIHHATDKNIPRQLDKTIRSPMINTGAAHGGNDRKTTRFL